jgi:hypothetical protein
MIILLQEQYALRIAGNPSIFVAAEKGDSAIIEAFLIVKPVMISQRDSRYLAWAYIHVCLPFLRSLLSNILH